VYNDLVPLEIHDKRYWETYQLRFEKLLSGLPVDDYLDIRSYKRGDHKVVYGFLYSPVKPAECTLVVREFEREEKYKGPNQFSQFVKYVTGQLVKVFISTVDGMVKFVVRGNRWEFELRFTEEGYLESDRQLLSLLPFLFPYLYWRPLSVLVEHLESKGEVVTLVDHVAGSQLIPLLKGSWLPRSVGTIKTDAEYLEKSKMLQVPPMGAFQVVRDRKVYVRFIGFKMTVEETEPVSYEAIRDKKERETIVWYYDKDRSALATTTLSWRGGDSYLKCRLFPQGFRKSTHGKDDFVVYLSANCIKQAKPLALAVAWEHQWFQRRLLPFLEKMTTTRVGSSLLEATYGSVVHERIADKLNNVSVSSWADQCGSAPFVRVIKRKQIVANQTSVVPDKFVTCDVVEIYSGRFTVLDRMDPEYDRQKEIPMSQVQDLMEPIPDTFVQINQKALSKIELSRMKKSKTERRQEKSSKERQVVAVSGVDAVVDRVLLNLKSKLRREKHIDYDVVKDAKTWADFTGNWVDLEPRLAEPFNKAVFINGHQTVVDYVAFARVLQAKDITWTEIITTMKWLLSFQGLVEWMLMKN
jgi:hypothetical protein